MMLRRLLTIGVIAYASVFPSLATGSEPRLPPSGGQQDALRVAVVVDTSQATSASMNFIRPAVAAMISGLPAGTEVLVATTGRRLQVRLPPTSDLAKASDSASKMTSDGGPTVLMDGLIEVDGRFMQKISGRRPAFVLVTGDGSESSRTVGTEFNAWLRTLSARGVIAHAVVLKSGNGPPEVIANALAQATGGRCETIGNAGLLQEKMSAIVTRFANR